MRGIRLHARVLIALDFRHSYSCTEGVSEYVFVHLIGFNYRNGALFVLLAKHCYEI